MRRQLAILTAALGAAAAALALLWPAPPPPAPAPAASGTTGLQPAAGRATSSEPPTPTLAQPQPDRIPSREEVEDEPLAKSRTVSVRYASGAPAPAAELRYLTEGEYRRRVRPRNDKQPRWPGVEQLGSRARTDLEGRARLPAADGDVLVVAAKDGEFGYARLRGEGEHTLRMAVDEAVSLRATFADGAPARAPLVVCQQVAPDETETIWEGWTDAAGEAVLAHFQLYRRAPPEALPDSFRERFAALVKLPTQPLVLQEFPGRPATDAPIELLLPDLGSVEVQLLCHSGAPLLSSARVGFGAERRERAPGSFPVSRRLLLQSANKDAGATTVQLPFAQVGQPLRVYARYPTERRAAYSETTPGPTRRCEVAELSVRPRPDQAVLAGRLLDEAGAPLAGRQLQLTIWRDEAVHATHTVETVEDGRWDCVVRGREDEARWRAELRLDPPHARSTLEGLLSFRPRGASVTMPPWPGGRRIDLGELRLAPLPTLCAGVVVDERGEPVPGAAIGVEQRSPDSERERTQRTGAPQNLRVLFGQNGRANLRGGGERWRRVRGLAAVSGTDGAFELCGDLPPGTVRVFADTPRHFKDSLPLTGPRTDLRIQLATNGVLVGQVLLPAWLPDRAATVRMEPVEEGRRQQDTRSEQVSARRGGNFRVEPLRVGRYRLQVLLRGLREPLAVVDGVFVGPGEHSDPRAAPLDLSESLQRYSLRALDDAGQPMDLDGPIHARLQALDGSWSEAGFRWQSGRAELITAHQAAELTFFGRGFAPHKQVYAPGEHVVYLRTHRPARINVSGARALSGPDRKVRISAILKGDTGYPSSLSGTDQQTGRRFWFPRWDLGRSSGGWLGATDLVEIPLMQAGKYELIFRAHANETTRTPQTQVSLGVFELTPGGAGSTAVPLPSAQVVEALQQLDKQWQERQEKRRAQPGKR